MTIRAKWYGEAVEALIAEGIVVAMAAEIPEGVETEGHAFMTAALAEYHKRGGKVSPLAIGSVAEAIRKVKEG